MMMMMTKVNGNKEVLRDGTCYNSTFTSYVCTYLLTTAITLDSFREYRVIVLCKAFVSTSHLCKGYHT